jgi:BirA family biotin operon repressor/biotin-[acetyl-CoA-carboxylase] ligase
VVTAREQTAGRGKPGNVWYSPPGGLYFSVILKPRKNPDDLSEFTLLAARAVVRALPVKAEIKLPNDILVEGKKICGILTEMTGSALIVGVGLNVNIDEFPTGFNATSLKLQTSKTWDLDQMLKNILSELKKEYSNFLSGKV